MLRFFITVLWFKIFLNGGRSDNFTVKNQPLWSYDDEKLWSGTRCRMGGRRQSPIDIRAEDVIVDFDRHYIKHGPLKFTGYKRVLMSGINNGLTVQFSTEGDEAIHPRLTGGPLNYFYRLEQLHFHWLSEHAVNGVKYPMEIHFVHIRSDLSLDEALKKSDGIAIVAVFVNIQAQLDDYREEVNEVLEYIPRLIKAGDRISGLLLDVTKLLSPNKESYYAYAGSLTSPECNEVVTWIIFEVPIYFNDAQYKMFGKIGVGRHNFRSLQKLNRHLIFSPGDKPHVPQFVAFFKNMYNVVTSFFENIITFVKNIRKDQEESREE